MFGDNFSNLVESIYIDEWPMSALEWYTSDSGTKLLMSDDNWALEIVQVMYNLMIIGTRWRNQ